MNGFNSVEHALLSEIEVAPMQVVDGVAVVSIVALMDSLMDANLMPGWGQLYSMPWDEQSALIQGWQEVHGAADYAACRENFSVSAAVSVAQDANRSIVVVTDLS